MDAHVPDRQCLICDAEAVHQEWKRHHQEEVSVWICKVEFACGLHVLISGGAESTGGYCKFANQKAINFRAEASYHKTRAEKAAGLLKVLTQTVETQKAECERLGEVIKDRTFEVNTVCRKLHDARKDCRFKNDQIKKQDQKIHDLKMEIAGAGEVIAVSQRETKSLEKKMNEWQLDALAKLKAERITRD